MNRSLPKSPLIEAEWLKKNKNNRGLLIIEARLKPIKAAHDWETGFKIPDARLMDIAKDFVDKHSELPHMLPGEAEFEISARNLGINSDSIIVLYDQVGIYASPRAWWMFKAMGHQHVYVLNGGMPHWLHSGYSSEKVSWEGLFKGNFKAKRNRGLLRNTEQVLRALQNPETGIYDARSEGRFLGIAPEPRAGLRLGHMPGAKNIPFPKVLNGYKLKDPQELKELFNVDKTNHIMTCGSGVTASILAFSAEVAGLSNISVYDGSWAEWGVPGDLPVV